MSLDGREVTVLGAGIGGMTAALGLAQRGAQVVVYEQADQLGEVGAGLQIGVNGIKVLDALGIGTEIRACATRPEAVHLRDGVTGRTVAQISMGQAAEQRYGAPHLQLHRRDLLDCLVTAAREAGVTIDLGRRLDSIVTSGTTARLTFQDGADLTAGLVVAADGVRSKIRAALFDGREPRFTGQVAWRALVAADRLPNLTADDAGLYMGAGGHVVAYPLRNGQLWNLVAVREQDAWVAEDWHIAAAPDDLRAAFHGWCPVVRHLLDAVEAPNLWGLFDHPPLTTWVNGPVALLGDACHPMLPFLAQGASMAIEDAWVLADSLSTVPQNEALARYQSKRLARATRVQRASVGNGRLYHLSNPIVRSGVHTGMRLTNRIAPMLLRRRVDWIYAHDVTRD